MQQKCLANEEFRMFDKPNQLIFYINVALTVFGALVALLTGYVVIGLIITICAALLIWDQFRQNKSTFTIGDLKKILTLHDTSGNKATLTQIQKTTACHVDNTEYWFRHIHAIGSISNFKVNHGHPDVQKNDNGSYQVCMMLTPDLKMTHGNDLTLSYQYEGAFTHPQGTLSHIIDYDTDRLHLVVELPEGRAVTSARVYCVQNGQEEALLPPSISGQTRIEADIRHPKRGAEYCLQWNWEKESLMNKIGQLF